MKQSIRISRNLRRAVINGTLCRYVPYKKQEELSPRVRPGDKTCCDHCVLQDKEALSRGLDRCLEGGSVRPRTALCGWGCRHGRLSGYWEAIE